MGTVEVAGLTSTLLVGVLEDDPLLSVCQSTWTRGHAVGAVPQSGTCHTLIWSLIGQTLNWCVRKTKAVICHISRQNIGRFASRENVENDAEEFLLLFLYQVEK